MAELVDALDLGSSVSRRAGSSPVRRTILGYNYKNNGHNSQNYSHYFFLILILLQRSCLLYELLSIVFDDNTTLGFLYWAPLQVVEI